MARHVGTSVPRHTRTCQDVTFFQKFNWPLEMLNQVFFAYFEPFLSQLGLPKSLENGPSFDENRVKMCEICLFANFKLHEKGKVYVKVRLVKHNEGCACRANGITLADLGW